MGNKEAEFNGDDLGIEATEIVHYASTYTQIWCQCEPVGLG